MKSKLSVLTAALLMTVMVTFAQEPKTSPSYPTNDLLKEFAHATNIRWKTVDEFYKASFMLDGAALEAYYSPEGQLTAVSRKLSIEQLPLVLIKEAREKSANNPVSDLFELSSDRGTEYYLVVSSDKETKTFRSEGRGWMRY